MSLNKKVAFYTLGCKVNQYETESIKKQFVDNGYNVVDFDDYADIYVVNSCTVTAMADKKTRNILRRTKKINKDSLLIVTGCYAQTNAKELEKINDIDYIVGNTDKGEIFNLISDTKKMYIKNIFDEKDYKEYSFTTFREMNRAYVKIQDGCDNFCSYCKIPFARGHKRSRQLESIIKEIKELAKEGFKEIILIGINLGSYGEDIGDIRIEDVIDEISKIDGIERIRLGSIYPDKITDRFINQLKTNNKLMPHLHISLQSGDDEILSLMKRKYDSKLVKNVLSKIKKEVKDIKFTGDVIVGFPHEKDKNFENTYNLIKDISFSDLHIFQYSDRENTLASTYQEKVSAETKKIRSKNLEKLAKEMYKKEREIYLNKELEVLVEEIKEGKSYGYSRNYLKVKIDEELEVNQIVKVKINNLTKGLLYSEYKKK
ncbi:threonylcarbamoyladenosine tRNA methylthiotransferase MtaB [Hypnocyclicus thermotrophus]|uniref:Threonylcarbamoyladenosine tRNA methylthiotransferase MtaB n=1 Tax=Hypnocyclicus thermotrophus TaxID=1627895 RepID=A0AA46DY74_9FUSO|nr:tRNA (N(6)-L-threonylcarbamoyladenosine(37)-C(2))-methylthiotransferase MtaB [Hypnocyclicus thermotrophus]TDT69768.1 threonylcarbamoyladenosine tRNA methylthiotransferase MtaB [Hypnocyclicus thermotrophus]